MEIGKLPGDWEKQAILLNIGVFDVGYVTGVILRGRIFQKHFRVLI